jgi:hypothetical protein
MKRFKLEINMYNTLPWDHVKLANMTSNFNSLLDHERGEDLQDYLLERFTNYYTLLIQMPLGDFNSNALQLVILIQKRLYLKYGILMPQIKEHYVQRNIEAILKLGIETWKEIYKLKYGYAPVLSEFENQ